MTALGSAVLLPKGQSAGRPQLPADSQCFMDADDEHQRPSPCLGYRVMYTWDLPLVSKHGLQLYSSFLNRSNDKLLGESGASVSANPTFNLENFVP